MDLDETIQRANQATSKELRHQLIPPGIPWGTLEDRGTD